MSNFIQFHYGTSRRASTGNQQRGGSRGVTRYYAEPSIPFAPDLRELSARALLKRGYVAQALIDSLSVLFCFFFILVTAASIPLAMFLLFFASF